MYAYILTFMLNSDSAFKLVHFFKIQSVKHKELFFFSQKIPISFICIQRNGRPIIYQSCGPSKLTNGKACHFASKMFMHLHNVSDWQTWLRGLGLVAVYQLYSNVFVVQMFHKIASNNH